jgi:hypothetical protein
MTRLELAAERFKAALERLENMPVPAPAAQAVENPAHVVRVTELERERERLLARIAVLEDEMAALTSIASEVEERLDGAIGEFRAAMNTRQ